MKGLNDTAKKVFKPNWGPILVEIPIFWVNKWLQLLSINLKNLHICLCINSRVPISLLLRRYFAIKLKSWVDRNMYLCMVCRDVARSENLGGQVVMRSGAAAWLRLLFCQNLGGLQHACRSLSYENTKSLFSFRVCTLEWPHLNS